MLWTLSLLRILATNIFMTGEREKEDIVRKRMTIIVSFADAQQSQLLDPLRIFPTTTESEVECTGSDYKHSQQ